ncbi:hypothetical protein KP509_10G030200 [Ceratopteris richardii]|uniref:IQ motif and ubiquitin-like domain-containing protein n=1 Tax=Ceratopteris richardii TaxID=49495 RepID=A0A8T2TXH3_CERRI|nr:hypothetical protein KP509_10G030200 [Ceratopteris richardii]
MEVEIALDEVVDSKEGNASDGSAVCAAEASTEREAHLGNGDRLIEGYIDRRTGTRFINAIQQTNHIRNANGEQNQRVTRATQLYETKNKTWNTLREASTQVERPDLVLDTKRDYILNCGPYEDSKAWEEKREKAATIIQRYARKRLARCKAKKLQKYAKERQELIAELEKKQKVEEDLQLKAEIYRHKQPRKKQDFNVLYQEVAAWHAEELQSIKGKGLSETEKKLALQELLYKEVHFLQAIEKMKMAADKENKEEKIREMMCRMSAPQKWELSDGRLVHVQTVDSLRALDMMRLYTALSKCSRTVDERMCVLGYIKWTVQEFDCQLTKDLIQLIEREADLMFRNRPTESLQGLRERILDLFLKIILMPKFNPEAASYQCVPNDFDQRSAQTMRQQAISI